MFRKLLIVWLAFLTVACVLIPSLRLEASAVKPEQLVNCDPDCTLLIVVQNADDLATHDLPDYVDILRVESSLDDETLTVVFYLKGLPQELTVNREGLSWEL